MTDTPPLLLVAPAWGSEIDEYENMDDVGYSRRPIVSQASFMELELDLTREDGTEGYFVHNARKPGKQQQDDSGYESLSEECDEHRGDLASHASHASSVRVSVEPRFSAGGPPPPTQMPASMIAHLARSLSGRKDGAFSPDEAWDLGPTDIKLADPVIIAGKSVDDGMRSGDESRPVLSRVESLSSSFMDFDLERTDDEACMNSVGGTLQTGDDIVEFSPPGPGALAVDLEMFTTFTVPLSRSSSTGMAGLAVGGGELGLSDRGSPSQGGASEAPSSSEPSQTLPSSPSPFLSSLLPNR
jgi:hypothetical protein